MPFPEINDHVLILTQPSGNKQFGLIYRGSNREVATLMNMSREGFLPVELLRLLDSREVDRRYQASIDLDRPANDPQQPPFYCFWEFFGRDRQAQLTAAQQTVAWLNEHLKLTPPLQLVIADDFQARLAMQAERGGQPESIFESVYYPLGEKR